MQEGLGGFRRRGGGHGSGERSVEKPCVKFWVVSPFRSVRHRLSVSTSFVLAALRALHVDASGVPALCGWDGGTNGVVRSVRAVAGRAGLAGPYVWLGRRPRRPASSAR